MMSPLFPLFRCFRGVSAGENKSQCSAQLVSLWREGEFK
jgi:hypothetical protein